MPCLYSCASDKINSVQNTDDCCCKDFGNLIALLD